MMLVGTTRFAAYVLLFISSPAFAEGLLGDLGWSNDVVRSFGNNGIVSGSEISNGALIAPPPSCDYIANPSTGSVDLDCPQGVAGGAVHDFTTGMTSGDGSITIIPPLIPSIGIGNAVVHQSLEQIIMNHQLLDSNRPSYDTPETRVLD